MQGTTVESSRCWTKRVHHTFCAVAMAATVGLVGKASLFRDAAIQIETPVRKLHSPALRKLEGDSDKHGVVVVVANQPKCGTGALLKSISEGMNCDDKNQRPVGPTVNGRQRVVRRECENESTMLKTHYAHDAQVALEEIRRERDVEPGKCVVVTAVRDPMTLLPSRFSQRYNKDLCDGKYTVEEVKSMYRDYLHDLVDNLDIPLYDDTLALLEAFGGTSIVEELQRQEAEGGHSYLANPAGDGPWRGCELLFLRTEYPSTWAEHLTAGTRGQIMTALPHTLKCDDGINLINQIKDSDQYVDEIAAIAKSRKIFADVMNFYGHNLGATHRAALEAQDQEQEQVQVEEQEQENVQGHNEDSKGMVVVIANQPKCGTGLLLTSVERGMGCVLVGHVGPMVGDRQRVVQYDCENNRTVVKTHYANDAGVALSDYRRDHYVEPGKCVVVTAVRNPLMLLPSRFAQRYSTDLCEGKFTADGLKDKYRTYLREMPTMLNLPLFEDTWELIQAFGGTSFTEELERQDREGGHSYLTNPAEDGPWKGCKLLFLKTEESSLWQEVLSEATRSSVEPENPPPVPRETCAEGVELVNSLKDPDQFIDEIVEISGKRELFGEVLKYYIRKDA